MADFLIKKLVENHSDIRNPKVRAQYGKVTGFVGVCVNVFLFALKFTAGTLFNSVAIIADAVNNLSDAGSSVISLISFKISGKPADKEHPFGHARIEYISSSVVALIILMVGFELLKTSINKIANPDYISFSILSVLVLLVSIAAKFWLYKFNIRIGKLTGSSIMKATAADSLSDVAATSAVLLSTILSPLLRYQLDGWMGAAVSVFIMISGLKILKETLDYLLGQEPSVELISEIECYIKKHTGIIGIHDLIVHNYGPQRCFATVHAEVDGNKDILDSHDLIDNIERDIYRDLYINLVIHMDPVIIDDPYVNGLYRLTSQAVSNIDKYLSIHDFRVVKGTTHSNLIFDITVPYETSKSDATILEEIEEAMREIDDSLFLVVTIDRAYVSYTNHLI